MKKINFKEGFTRIKIVWFIFFLVLGLFTLYFPHQPKGLFSTSCWINIFGPFFGNSLVACEYFKSIPMYGIFYLHIALIPVFFYDINGSVDLVKRTYLWISSNITFVIFYISVDSQEHEYLFFVLGITVFGIILFKTMDFIKDGFLKK
jgi:hypothetical protein